MKTKTLNSVPSLCGIVVLVLFVFLNDGKAASLIFDPTVTIDFESLDIGQPISEVGWTASGAAVMTGAVPRAGDPSSRAIQTDAGTTKRVAWSPEQEPDFTSNTLFFSAWVNMTNDSESGARVQIAKSTAGGSGSLDKLGGFGIVDANDKDFAFYDASTASWIYSEVKASPNVWYEMALVVELNPSAWGQSLGYLYYRTADASEFTLLPEFDGYQMSWYTESLNASHFAYWRIEHARVNVQLDNFSAGMVVPEPRAAMLLGLSLGVLLFLRRRRPTFAE